MSIISWYSLKEEIREKYRSFSITGDLERMVFIK